MRTLRCSRGVLGVILSLLFSLGGLAMASAPASAGTKWKVAASATAKGLDKIAGTNTEILKPVKIEVTVTAASFVQWTIYCHKGGKLIMLPSGSKTLTAAGSVQLKFPKSASDCEPSASAENSGTGSIKLSIEFSGGSVQK
jgi:hypothetical protein